MTMGRLLIRIERLQMVSNRNDESEEGRQAAQVTRLIERFCEIANSKFGLELNSTSNLRDAMEGFLQRQAQNCGMPSPEKCQQLERLFWLSTEFSDVLRGPSSNFTSFLSRTARVVAGRVDLGIEHSRLKIKAARET